MKLDLSLGQLFRYAFTGGMAVPVYYLHCLPFGELIRMEPTVGQVSAVSAVALVLGASIQVVHRSLLYPPILRLIHWRFSRGFGKDLGYHFPYWNPYVQTSLEFDFDHARWQRKKSADTVQASLDAWGDQAHYLYASALGILLALLGCRILCPHPGGVASVWFLAAAGVFAVGAFVHDTRLMRVEGLVVAADRDIDLLNRSANIRSPDSSTALDT